MRNTELMSRAVHGALNHLAQELPLPFKGRLVKPTNVYVAITRQCNLRCVMCGIPDVVYPHLTVDEWKGIFDSIADWAAPACKIQISGGEPLVFDGIYEILEHCVARNLLPGVTTNGTLVTEKQAERLMSLGLSNVNISLDGVGPVQDAIRGYNAANKKIQVWDKTDAGIRNLIASRNRNRGNELIILKCCLMPRNAEDVVNLVKYTEEVGADWISFQPLELRDVPNHEKLTFDDAQQTLIEASDVLLELKKAGAPIANSELHLDLFKAFFKDPHSGDYPGRQRCPIGWSSLSIHSDGRMEFCNVIGIMGNARDTSPQSIWESSLAAKQRKAVASCTKGCLQTCYSNKTLIDKARVLLRMARRRR